MTEGRLSAFQRRLLAILSGVRPRWRLTGGAALVGFHAGHRTTRDLDLFWPHVDHFEQVVAGVERVLVDAGVRVDRIQRARTFVRLAVSQRDETCVVDLVSDPTTIVDPPVEVRVEGTLVLIDSPQEILTNKLCALLSRSEIRDLVDARWLLENGADLQRAVREAQEKDGGFSAAVLAWVLQGTNLEATGRAAGADPRDVEDLRRWRDVFVERLVAMSTPSRRDSS